MSTIKNVTMKSSTEDIKKFLSETSKTVAKRDKNLYSRMQYTSNAITKGEKVTKRDLFDLAKDVMTLLATPVAAEEKKTDTKKTTKKTEAKPKSENALKKSGTLKSKKSTEDTESTEKTEPKEKTSKKSSKKEDELKKQAKLHTQEYVAEFPQTLERDGNKYELARDIKSIKDIYKAYEKGEQFIFAFVWTKRHLMQFDYFPGIIDQPSEFEDNLDLTAMMYISDELRVAYTISTTTDALYVIKPDEFKSYAPEAGRFCDGMEYEIYRVVETAEDED